MGLPGLPSSQAPRNPDNDIYRRFEGIERTIRELGPSIAASFSGTIATLQTQQTTLETQQATLSDQQTQLSNQLTSINTLIGEQVSGGTDTANSGGAIAVSVGGTYTLATVAVPAGYTRAIASGTSSVTVSGTNPLAQVATNISGHIGYALPIYSNSDNFESGSPSHAVTLSGLSGGTITCGAYMSGLSSVTSAYIINTLTVIFLR